VVLPLKSGAGGDVAVRVVGVCRTAADAGLASYAGVLDYTQDGAEGVAAYVASRVSDAGGAVAVGIGYRIHQSNVIDAAAE